MSEAVKPPRTYRSPRRTEQARATRRAILDAARDLFVGQGYATTTIAGIAARADVSAETVYAAFRTKRALLGELVDVSIAGGVDAPPVMAQAWVADLGAEPDPRGRLRILAREGSRILQRRSALDQVVHGAAAADPELANVWARLKAERHAGQLALLRLVFAGSDLPRTTTIEAAADVLYALGSPETYRLLVVDRGWSHPQFERWYGDTLEHLILGGA